jgi:peptidyl-prolyl cis-trans isomerase C
MSSTSFSSRAWTALLAGGIGTGLICGSVAQEEPATETSESYSIVEVNGVSLTAAKADALADSRMKAFASQIPEEQVEQLQTQLRTQIQEEFVVRVLLEAASEEREIKIEESAIDDEIERVKGSLPPSMSYEQLLAMQGVDEAGFRDRVRLQLGLNEILDQELKDQSGVPEEEIADFFEQQKDRMSVPATAHARHILITFDAEDDEDAKDSKRKQLAEIRKKILDGADFAELAKSESDCPSSAKGGDLGTFPRGQMVPSFEEATFSQPVGEVGEIVETQFGYHLIEVIEQNEAQVRTLEDVRGEIETYLQSQKRSTVLQTYIEGLKSGAEITYPAEPATVAIP